VSQRAKRRKVPSWRVERFDDGGKFVHGARCAGGCDYGCVGGRFVEKALAPKARRAGRKV